MDNVGHLVNREGFEYRVGSALDVPLVSELVDRCDVTIHLAAAVGVMLIVDRPVHTIETNVRATEVVLGAAAKQKLVLLASTSEVYGKGIRFPSRKMTISSSARRSTPGGRMPVPRHWTSGWPWPTGKKKVPVIITRFFNTVGPRQTGRYGMVLPNFAAQAVQGEPIRVFESGEQARCFGHVYDAVEAMLRLIATPAAVGQVVNVGNDREVTINQLADMVRTIAEFFADRSRALRRSVRGGL